MPTNQEINKKTQEACNQFSKDVSTLRREKEELYTEIVDLRSQLKERSETIRYLKERISILESGLVDFKKWIKNNL